MKTLFLIPPSEGKNSDNKTGKSFSKVFSELSFSELNDFRKEVIHYLNRMEYKEKDLEKMTGLKGKNIEEAYEMNKRLMNSEVKRTIELFDGTMFKSIDYSNMDNKSKTFFEKHFGIFNALLGVNKPLDLIPEFKVKPEGYIEKKKIHRYWKEKMDNIFDDNFVFDILTSNYRKMVDNDKFYKIDFYLMKKDDLKSAGHISKKYRGQLIKHLCQNQIIDLESVLKIKTENLELFEYDEKNKEIKMIIKN
ncbi:MAG: peroxide stress protein YaaA [Thermotogota bacterium]